MLSVQNLNRYTDTSPREPLLSGISLELEAGRCAVVSGASGAGKTLLLRSLVDLDANQGEVSLDAERRDKMEASRWRSRLCYVPAEPAWWAEYVKDHFPDLKAAKTAAASFGLADDLFEQPVARLSTGERQRLALVRAFAILPDILLLDEPTAALDPQSTHQVEDALEAFMNTGKSVILVTHDEAQGQRMGDDFYEMDAGHLNRTGIQP